MTAKLRQVRLWRMLPQDYETPTGISEMVPDESYTIREIMEKHTSGLTPAIAKEPRFDSKADFDSEDIEKMAHLDLFDRELESRRIADEMIQGEKALNKKRIDDAARAETEKAELAEIKKELKQRKQASAINDPGLDLDPEGPGTADARRRSKEKGPGTAGS